MTPSFDEIRFPVSISLKASGGPGPVPGIIAGVSAVLSTALGLGIMYVAGVFFSPIALLIVAYAGFRAHRIASGG